MDLKEQGIPLVGTYCTFMRRRSRWRRVRWWSRCAQRRMKPSEEAEKDLPRNLCPLIKSSYGFGKTDKCPYFYFSDLVVGETTCDGKKKMYEYMAEFKAVHVMQLPNSRDARLTRAVESRNSMGRGSPVSCCARSRSHSMETTFIPASFRRSASSGRAGLTAIP